MKSTCLFLASLLGPAAAFAPSAPTTRTSPTALSAQVTRSQVLNDVAATFGMVAASTLFNPLVASADETLPSGIVIKVVKSGDGPAPDIGELAAIRFASYAGENKIDDIFETPEPYYTRVGSGGLIKGVEEVLPKMRVGDRWVLTIPVSAHLATTTVRDVLIRAQYLSLNLTRHFALFEFIASFFFQ